MNGIPLTFLKEVNIPHHMTIGENLLILLGITVIIVMVLLLTNGFDKGVIPLACMIGVIMGGVILLFINLIAFERIERQYVSKVLTVERISNTSEPDNNVVEVSDGKETYMLTDIKGTDQLSAKDRFYLKSTGVSGDYQKKETYMLNQFEDSDIKIVRVKGE